MFWCKTVTRVIVTLLTLCFASKSDVNGRSSESFLFRSIHEICQKTEKRVKVWVLVCMFSTTRVSLTSMYVSSPLAAVSHPSSSSSSFVTVCPQAQATLHRSLFWCDGSAVGVTKCGGNILLKLLSTGVDLLNKWRVCVWEENEGEYEAMKH